MRQKVVSLRSAMSGLVLWSLSSVGLLAVAGMLTLFYWNRSHAVARISEELMRSAPRQMESLIPGLLLPEQARSVPLLLERLKQEEGLSAAQVLNAGSEPPFWIHLCSLTDQPRSCLDDDAKHVVLVYPISESGQVLGYLLKARTIGSDAFGQQLLFATAVSLGILALCFMVLAWQISRLTSTKLPRSLETIEVWVEEALRSGAATTTPPDLPFRELVSLSDKIGPIIDRYHSTARLAAIATTTQLLAHDVRKPFSILRMGLSMLERAKSPASVRQLLQKLIPEVDRAMISVNGLIQDVMEVGSTSSRVDAETVSPVQLLETALGDLMRVYPRATLDFRYQLAHSRQVRVDALKVGRVLGNILGNAVQALNQQGILWLRTQDRGDFVEFSIGNAGSLIAPEDLPRLFDSFFTQGKKGGTGLGLAIAQKIVTAHGGRIWCTSQGDASGGHGLVEFLFTLPAAGSAERPCSEALPVNSAQLRGLISLLADLEPGDWGTSPGADEIQLEDRLLQASARLRRPLKVLLVDDEEACRTTLAWFLSRTQQLAAAIQVVHADSDVSALGAIAVNRFDLVISDIDLGPTSLDGLALTEKLRVDASRSCMPLFGISSNHIGAADRRNAAEAGAEVVLPKPVGRSDLLNALVRSVERVQDLRPEVAVVEDNVFVLEAWEDVLKPDAVVHTFSSPEDLRCRLLQEPDFLQRLCLLITDFRFDASPQTGLAAAQLTKARRPELAVLLSSECDFAVSDLHGVIDQVIAKEPIGLRDLLSSLPSERKKASESGQGSLR